MNLFKRIFRFNKKDNNYKPINLYCIEYIVDGNLDIVLKYYCYATNKSMAQDDFWDVYNSLYTDIISIRIVE